MRKVCRYGCAVASVMDALRSCQHVFLSILVSRIDLNMGIVIIVHTGVGWTVALVNNFISSESHSGWTRSAIACIDRLISLSPATLITQIRKCTFHGLHDVFFFFNQKWSAKYLVSFVFAFPFPRHLWIGDVNLKPLSLWLILKVYNY